MQTTRVCVIQDHTAGLALAGGKRLLVSVRQVRIAVTAIEHMCTFSNSNSRARTVVLVHSYVLVVTPKKNWNNAQDRIQCLFG